DSVLKGAISDIRNALGDDPKQPRFIETIPRRGYRFVARPVVAQSAALVDVAAGFPVPAPDPFVDEASTEEWFVGRHGEVEQLRRAWQRAAAGRRTLAWVTG